MVQVAVDPVASPEELGVVEILWHVAVVLDFGEEFSLWRSFTDMSFGLDRNKTGSLTSTFMVLEFIYNLYILIIYVSAWHNLEKYIPSFFFSTLA